MPNLANYITKHQKSLCTIAGIMLLLGILPLPYSYYILLRWSITFVALYVAFLKFIGNYETAGFIMLAIALLFNPFSVFTMSKSNWMLIDLVVAIIFFAFSTTND